MTVHPRSLTRCTQRRRLAHYRKIAFHLLIDLAYFGPQFREEIVPMSWNDDLIKAIAEINPGLQFQTNPGLLTTNKS